MYSRYGLFGAGSVRLGNMGVQAVESHMQSGKQKAVNILQSVKDVSVLLFPCLLSGS